MRRDLTTAVRLIDHALERAATVAVLDDVPARDGTSVVIRVRATAARRSATLVLHSDDDIDSADGDRIVVVLRRASAARLRALRAANRQFVDVGRGVVRLQLPWLMVDRSDVDLPATAATRRGFRNAFGDRASLITRLLVEQPGRDWGTRELAAVAGVSSMTASHVIRQLRELSAVAVHKRGRASDAQVVDLHGLIAEWTRHYDWRQSQSLTVLAPIGSMPRFLQRLPKSLAKRRWALTLQAGASLVAPHAAWDTVHVYVDLRDSATLGDVAAAAGWEPGPGGKLVLMSPSYAHSAWMGMHTVEGLNVVSDLQLVLDLWHYPVRGREQADALLAMLGERVGVDREAARARE